MKLLIAPDSFKDALDARQVAGAIAQGVRDARPDAAIELCPLGDGGEGTGRILAAAARLERQRTIVLDPLGRRREASWWRSADKHHAIVEMSEASGLWLLSADQRDALRSTSYGTGQLLSAAAKSGARDITLCVGGSATVDGGAGCLQALGWTLIDAGGDVIDSPARGEMLARIASAPPPAKSFGAQITILCDVDNPLLGSRGAAAVFAPQKGASPGQVAMLETGLTVWRDVLLRETGRDVGSLARGGAAGGLPAGLHAALDARLVSGIDEVLRSVDFQRKASDADMILTGEGRLDEQTRGGKVVSGVVRVARSLHKPVIAFVGEASAEMKSREALERFGLAELVPITPPGDSLEKALRETDANLVCAAQESFSRSR